MKNFQMSNIDYTVLVLAIAIFLPGIYNQIINYMAGITFMESLTSVQQFVVICIPMSVLSIFIIKLIKTFYKHFVNRINKGDEMISLAIGLFVLGYISNDFYIFSKEFLSISLYLVSFSLFIFTIVKDSEINIVDVIITFIIALLTIFEANLIITGIAFFILVQYYAMYMLAKKENDSDVVNTAFGLTTVIIPIIKKIVLR